jgi:tRNA (cytidine/uridine-2'-O-)-methyltransferase
MPESGRCRSPASGLHVVLVHPEIPPNTGSIGRLCAATGSRLHLIEPLGFSLDDRYLKRAGLDYWQYVDLVVHESWPAFLRDVAPPRAFFYSARAEESYLAARYATVEEAHLVFGRETSGLPPDIMAANRSCMYRIPIFSSEVRSLNLSNAVSIVVYEALRQRGALDASSSHGV